MKAMVEESQWALCTMSKHEPTTMLVRGEQQYQTHAGQ
jgi:hypothetical protein